MGEDALLYNCDTCNYIYSYHYGCLEISNPTDNHGRNIFLLVIY